MTEKPLGRSLGAILDKGPADIVTELPVDHLSPNRFQPRRLFPLEEMEGLMRSIEENGILQPVIARRTQRGYELVAGERRWRAAKELKLRTIPAVIKDVDDGKMLEIALIENIQRQDLNPIERARGYKTLIERFELTHDEAADRIGVERPTVTNMLRLLTLPEDVQAEVSRGTISMGHARALLTLQRAPEQRKVCLEITNRGLSVRDTEKLVAKMSRPATSAARRQRSPHLADLEATLRNRLRTKVTIIQRGKRGKIIIDFHSVDEFQRIWRLLTH